MTIQGHAPRLLFLDSGVGGLTVLRAARAAMPEAEVLFVADDASFPYGSKEESVLVARLTKILESAINNFSPDCIILACNTASTVALEILRQRSPVPIVGTVPAVKPAAALTKSGLVSVLATPGTVQREYTRALIDQFGGGARFKLVGSAHLADLAEAFASGGIVNDAAIRGEIEPCFIEEGGSRTDVVVLGCTHYPLLLDRLDALAPWPVTWIDPAPAIARRIANILAHAGHFVGVGAKRGPGFIHFTSGREPSPHLLSLLKLEHLEARPFEAVFAA